MRSTYPQDFGGIDDSRVALTEFHLSQYGTDILLVETTFSDYPFLNSGPNRLCISGEILQNTRRRTLLSASTI